MFEHMYQCFYIKNKKTAQSRFLKHLYCPLDLAASDAAGAYQHFFWSAVDDGLNALQIWRPCPFGADVRVAQFHPDRNAFAAYDALSSHIKTPPLNRLFILPKNVYGCKGGFYSAL